MAKDYGTPIKPYIDDSTYIDKMCDHTGWSKSQLISHMVNSCMDSVLSMPAAPKPASR